MVRLQQKERECTRRGVEPDAGGRIMGERVNSLCSSAAGIVLSQSASAEVASRLNPCHIRRGVALSGSSQLLRFRLKLRLDSAGTQPQIQLNYNSQTLGGALGAGWSLGGLSAITRGPRDVFVDGTAGAINLDDNDALYLDGQRIVRSRGRRAPAQRVRSSPQSNDDFTELPNTEPT